MENKDKYKVNNTYEKNEIIQITKKAWDDVINRLDELEESEYHNAMAIERLEKINEYESNIDDVCTETADQMFEKLGYKKEFSDKNGCNYYIKEINRSGIKSRYVIHVLSNESSTLYGKYESFPSLDGRKYGTNISVAEDKAIHKKLEELKSNNTKDITEEIGYNCWVIYTDDPQFEGKRNYLRKYFNQGVCFTDEIQNAKKYPSFPEVLRDMDIIKNKYGIECFAKITVSRKNQNE